MHRPLCNWLATRLMNLKIIIAKSHPCDSLSAIQSAVVLCIICNPYLNIKINIREENDSSLSSCPKDPQVSPLPPSSNYKVLMPVNDSKLSIQYTTAPKRHIPTTIIREGTKTYSLVELADLHRVTSCISYPCQNDNRICF